MRKQETAAAWLERQFANSYCPDCGGDAQHHHVILVMGTFYARCEYPPLGGSLLCGGAVDPVIRKYRESVGEPLEGFRLVDTDPAAPDWWKGIDRPQCRHGNFPGYCAACAGEE